MPGRQGIHKLALFVKQGNTAAEAISSDVSAWLREKGVETAVISHPRDNCRDALPPQTDMILVFGGDGTIVSVARATLGMGVPVAGVNFGGVGFLAELGPEDWQAALQTALERGVKVEPRMALSCALYRDAACLFQREVVNDAVVTRGRVARLVRLRLSVNGEPFLDIRSDGLIVSTPTGSSGYAGSAGGPLIMPALNAYVVAAICPYLSGFPPLALSSETVFSVTVREAEPDLYLTLDGQEVHSLAEGDRLDVRGVPERILLADFGRKDYFGRLRRAGFVRGGAPE